MKKLLLVACACLLVCSAMPGPASAREMRVVFLNPGSVEDIGMWGLAANFMQAAADSLGIRLEVLYADRNHVKMLELAEEVSRRADSPDYVILVNEKQAGPAMMSLFKGSRPKILLMHNDLTAGQRKEFGGERARMLNWIGTLTTDDHLASMLLIQALTRRCPGYPEAVAISGIQSNPVTEDRERGLKDFFLDPVRGRLVQVAHANWGYTEGKARAQGLLNRYPSLSVIWAANDSMAMGAFDAVREAGLEKRIIVGGLGGFPEALKSIQSGGLKVSVGGHSTTGAWALVLLYDYHHGQDFIGDIGVNRKVNHLTIIDSPEKAALFEKIIINHPETINFRLFSKTLNPRREKYDFRYETVVKAAGGKLPQ